MVTNIYRAADAFIYLPTYIAECNQVFQTIDRTLDVRFRTPGGRKSGDSVAVHELLTQSAKNTNEAHIAICDPLTIFNGQFTKHLHQLRIFAALITKPPFWAVNTIERDFEDEKSLGEHFQQVIYYNEKLITGNFIGKRLKKHAQIANALPVNFGEEIPLLLKERQGSPETVAVTADVVTLAQAASEHGIRINHRFCNNPFYAEFLSTGLVTTKECCEQFPRELSNILNGIQRAILILRSSKKIAYDACLEVATNPNTGIYQSAQRQLTAQELTWIVELIHSAGFYPATLEVTRRQWLAAIKARAKVEMWDSDETKENESFYDELVFGKFIRVSRAKLAREIGPVEDEEGRKGLIPITVDILGCQAARTSVQVAFVCCIVLFILSKVVLSRMPFLKLVDQRVIDAMAKLQSPAMVAGFFLIAVSAPYHPKIHGLLAKLRGNKKHLNTVLNILLLLLTGASGLMAFFLTAGICKDIGNALFGVLGGLLLNNIWSKIDRSSPHA